MVDAGYGKSLYGDTVYGSNIYKVGTRITCGLKARVIPAPAEFIPPVIDTIVEGLVERFDWLQQMFQAVELLSTIEYAPGRDPARPNDKLNLDDAWGELYKTPRLTGESDSDYRARLQTRVKVLTGSGTTANAAAVLDHLVQKEGATVIESRWPAQAIINFNSVSAIRRAQQRRNLIDIILPDLFAAGITPLLYTPLYEIGLNAAVAGDTGVSIPIRAAIAGEPSLSVGLDALVALGKDISTTELYAAVQGERGVSTRLNAAVSTVRSTQVACRGAIAGDRVVPVELWAAIQGDIGLRVILRGAVQAGQKQEIALRSAAAKGFRLSTRLLACCKLGFEINNIELHAAVQGRRSASCGLRARVARRIE